MPDFDVVVIGGGSAGFAAADRAAENGAKTALVEAGELGGNCPSRACVPTNIFAHASKLLAEWRRAERFGISMESVRFDPAKLKAHQDRVIAELTGSRLKSALDDRGISLLPHRARFKNESEIEADGRTVSASKFIIATGSRPSVPPIPGLDKTGFITSDEAVDLRKWPRSITIIGGGPVGVEFALIFRRFGAGTTLIEMGERLLPEEDSEITELLKEYLRAEGIEVRLATAVELAGLNSGLKETRLAGAAGSGVAAADEILIAVGREPFVGDLNPQTAGVEIGPGGITVDKHLETSAKNILACGDVTGKSLYTHFAAYQGDLAGFNATSDQKEEADYRVVPRVTFTDPEVAAVGLTEAAAVSAYGRGISVGRMPYRYLAKSLIEDDRRGLIKLVSRDDEIVGGHIIGARAGELIHEIAVAMRGGLGIEDLAQTIHAYPTTAEGIAAAAADLAVSREVSVERAA